MRIRFLYPRGLPQASCRHPASVGYLRSVVGPAINKERHSLKRDESHMKNQLIQIQPMGGPGAAWWHPPLSVIKAGNPSNQCPTRDQPPTVAISCFHETPSSQTSSCGLFHNSVCPNCLGPGFGDLQPAANWRIFPEDHFFYRNWAILPYCPALYLPFTPFFWGRECKTGITSPDLVVVRCRVLRSFPNRHGSLDRG